MKMRLTIALSILTVFGVLPAGAVSQSLIAEADTPATEPTAPAGQADLGYVRPPHRTMAINYLFDAFGPYPTGGAAVAAGINQLNNAPPEWKQGAAGYGRRFGSDFGMAAAGTTTRYALSEAFREDTLYYRCECRGILPRVSHAVISTLTARRGMDGHRVFSFSALAGEDF